MNLYDLLWGGLVGLSIFAVVLIVIIMAGLVIYLAGLFQVFKKAGRNGWEAIVPIYSIYVLVRIAGLNWWYFLLIISGSIMNILGSDYLGELCDIGMMIGTFFVWYNISKKFHKDTVMAVLMTIFPFIMIPIMGFSSEYVFDDSVEVSLNGPIQGENVKSKQKQAENDFNYQKRVNYCGNCGGKIDCDVKYCPHCGKEI